MGGDWGWQGFGNRAQEFPDGEQVAVSPDGRARIRYNRALNRFEQSLDGAAYVAFGGGGGVTPDVLVEFTPLALSKKGGPGATDEIIGSTDIPAVNLTSATQLLSTRVVAASGWDSASDVTVGLGLALDGAQSNNDTLDVDIDYIYTRSGTAALADLNKPITTLSETLTVTTAEGLIDETLYNLTFTLDRNDATNPYAGETVGGFGFRLHIGAGSSIGSIYLVGVFMQFAVS